MDKTDVSGSAGRKPAGQKILFVDDEGDWRLIPVMFLKDAGYEVLTAANATEAMVQADSRRFDLVILDVNLAGENGVQLMRFLKHNHPGVPVILYTGAEHDAEAVQKMLQAGALQYLRKGSMEELVRVVQAALDAASA